MIMHGPQMETKHLQLSQHKIPNRLEINYKYSSPDYFT